MLDFVAQVRSETRGRPLDVAIAALADNQHGVVARRQLAALGVGPGAIRIRLSAGRLHRVHRGVFAVGRRGLTQRGRWMAAVLSCGDQAALSHRSAAALWGITRFEGQVDVTVPGTRRRPRPGIRLHSDLLDAKDRATRDGIPVTSIARTLLGLAQTVDAPRLARAVEEAERLRLFDAREIERLCSKADRQRGAPSLRRALAAFQPLQVVRSELEREFLRLCRKADVATPAMNTSVAGLEVDAAWNGPGLVVELDGYAFHGSRTAFERDRERDATLQAAGYRVIRVTARRLRKEPEVVIAAIRRLLTADRSTS